MVVAQSLDTMANARRFYAPEISGTRIPLGIVRPTAEPTTRAALGLDESATLLVTVGRLVARKGTSQLITMMEGYRGQNVQLLIMGSGPEMQPLKEQVQVRGLEANVRFLGHVTEEQKQQTLALSDLYVSTSQHEGFGLVFLEAMAAGLPVVCYDNGGQTDFLRDRETGYLVSLNNLNTFKERSKALINDPALRRKMGERNRELVEDLYIDQCATRYVDVFHEVLDMRTSPSRRLVLDSPVV
jgi:glycosyltransferase involved in cell wall biosynthesis